MATDWQKVAAHEAEEAHENNFKSRRGLHRLDNGKGETLAFCFYNNNPYRDHVAGPMESRNTKRGRELQRVRAWLAGQKNMREVGFAVYPPEEGYTFALIIESDDTSAEAEEAIAQALVASVDIEETPLPPN